MIVLDASLMVARLLDEPHRGLDDELYDLLDADRVIVPAHWPMEVANALRMSIRRNRISDPDLTTLAEYLEGFEIIVNPPFPLAAVPALARFAGKHDLTAYDAAYLQIALEHRARLATVDRPMRAAAQRLGIPLLPA